MTTGTKLILWRTDDPKVFTEGDVQWIITDYSEPLCSRHCPDDLCPWPHPDVCAACGEMIYEGDHLVCLDGGDAAHLDCVKVHASYPHSQDSLYDCPACDVGDDGD